MINLKNILKVLLIAVFVVAWSGNAEAQGNLAYGDTSNNINTTDPTKPNYIPGAQPLVTYEGEAPKKNDTENVDTNQVKNIPQDPTFCGSNYGIFSELVQTGQLIFNRLRDLIYVVAGFGIIAVAVGGFFGNLNWKWLGAIVISLVVIATAGELIVLMTGCETFGSKLITNTLKEPTPLVAEKDGINPYTDSYTNEYTSEPGVDIDEATIEWNAKIEKSRKKSYDHSDKYPGTTSSQESSAGSSEEAEIVQDAGAAQS